MLCIVSPAATAEADATAQAGGGRGIVEISVNKIIE